MIIVSALLIAVAASIIIICLKIYRSSKKKQNNGLIDIDEKILLTFDTTEDPARIRNVLKTALQSGCQLRITLNNRGNTFNSSLLAVAADSIVIDALYPQEGNVHIADAKNVELEILIRKLTYIPFQCTSCFMGHESHGGYPALRLTFPEKLTRDQKRNYHRVEVTPEDNVRVAFSVDEKKVSCPVANISGAGIGFYSHYDTTVLHHGRVIEHPRIEMMETLHIDCMTIIYAVSQMRYPVVIRGDKYQYYYGAEFTAIGNDIREKIIQYVIDKERDELKESRPML